MKKALALLLVLVLAFSLAACGNGGDKPAPATDAPATDAPPPDKPDDKDADEEPAAGDNVIKIGSLHNETGWFATYDYNNVLEMKMLADYYNEQGGIEIGGEMYTIQVINHDGQSDSEGIRSAAQLLADEEDLQFVVTTNDFWVEGSLDIFEDAKIMSTQAQNNMGIGAINPDLKYAYCLSNGAAAQYSAAMELIKTNYPDAKTLVHCSNEDGLMDHIHALMSTLCEEYDLELLDSSESVIYDAEATDFSATALRLINSGADVFIGNADFNNTAAITKELRNNGSDMIAAAIVGANAQVLIDASGLDDLSNAFTMGPDLANLDNNTEIFQTLFNKFKEDHGEENAAAWNGMSINCMYALLNLMKACGSTDAEDVMTYLETAEEVETIFGIATVGGLETYGVNHLLACPQPSTMCVDGEVVFGGWFDTMIP